MRAPQKPYVWTTAAVGVGVLAASFASLAATHDHLGWILLAALAMLTGVFPVQIGSAEASISVADTFFIARALLFGPAPATVAVAADSLVMSLAHRRHGLQRGLFKTAAPRRAMYAAGTALFPAPG